MDSSREFTKPGIGRGGRGAALQQLLKSKAAPPGDAGRSDSESIGKPAVVRGQVLSPSHGPIEKPGLSGTLMLQCGPSTSTGRGQMFSQLLKSSGRGVSRGRGSGLLLGKEVEKSQTQANGDSNGHAYPEQSVAKIPSPSRSVSAADDLSQSMERVDLDRREIVHYQGETGTPVPVKVNCVRLKYTNKAVYQYRVNFSPELDSKNMRFMMLNQHREVIGGTKAFDGATLYLPKELPQGVTKLKSVRLTDNVEIAVTITFTRSVDPSSSFLIPFYSTVLRKCMSAMQMCAVGRNHYDPQSAKRIERLGLSLWPGYVTAIRGFEGGLLLNLDVSHKVLRSDTAHSIMKRIYDRSPKYFKENCVKELVGSVVLTRYNNKNYRIDDIAWNLTPTSFFTNTKGESITFQDYYQIQYKININDLLQPLLIHRPKRSSQRMHRLTEGKQKEICLVPELCYLTGLSDSLRTDFRAMKDIKEQTCVSPTERNASIEQFLDRLQSSPAAREELAKWGLEFDSQTAPVDAREFPMETVKAGGNVKFPSGPQADFSREVGRAKVLVPVHLESWLLFFTRRDANKARAFFQKMIEVCEKLGIHVSQPHFVELTDDRSTTYKDAIASAINVHVQLVVCIFPTSRDDRYSALKKLCCIDMPVPSQVILSKSLPDDSRSGKFRSVTMKIALQINCKLGGELWALDIPLRGLMVCGIDVYHDPSARGNSVAAFVASLNKFASRWYSKAILQKPHQEVIDSLKNCFIEAIKKYYEVNNALPERIVIYRDGVGDGQLRFVSEHEMPQLQSCFPMFENIRGGPYCPKFTIVIVSKRINIRFFAYGQRSLDNPNPGTVLDHTVTRQFWPDFYLVSQHVRHGTVSPTHYIVVYGHENLKPDHIQRLSYKLTHMYYNWPGTIRVPAPCQYAHKLAYLVGQSIRKEPSPQLSDRLFYL